MNVITDVISCKQSTTTCSTTEASVPLRTVVFYASPFKILYTVINDSSGKYSKKFSKFVKIFIYFPFMCCLIIWDIVGTYNTGAWKFWLVKIPSIYCHTPVIMLCHCIVYAHMTVCKHAYEQKLIDTHLSICDYCGLTEGQVTILIYHEDVLANHYYYYYYCCHCHCSCYFK
jgi:hypothetical protein